MRPVAEEYHLSVPSKLADRFETIKESDGHGSIAAAMKHALHHYVDSWEERQIMLQAEREIEEEKGDD